MPNNRFLSLFISLTKQPCLQFSSKQGWALDVLKDTKNVWGLRPVNNYCFFNL
ncbi:hypothetical protein HDF23_001167 [Mucilaginibacter lappiensis]|uniref:Uncharacterized protein n=1 Tax=Mucilaginibacter lappiensis TaxID=354630 RepID=A0ABR6PFA2_9SPHI|nr:hypothetical protein [Mucilaginibacter lappiensis]